MKSSQSPHSPRTNIPTGENSDRRLARSIGTVDFDIFAHIIDPFCIESEKVSASLTGEESDLDAIFCVFLIFEHHKLLDHLQISLETFFSWAHVVYEHHHRVDEGASFFNFYRSLDVLRRIHSTVIHPPSERIRSQLSEIDIFSLFFSAINSFVQHAGFATNSDLCAVGHPLALRYNDLMPMQQHASCMAFALLGRNHHKILYASRDDDAHNNSGSKQVPDLSASSDIAASLRRADAAAPAQAVVLRGHSQGPSPTKSTTASRNRFGAFRRCVIDLLSSSCMEGPVFTEFHKRLIGNSHISGPLPSTPLLLTALYLNAFHGWSLGQSNPVQVQATRWLKLLAVQLSDRMLPLCGGDTSGVLFGDHTPSKKRPEDEDPGDFWPAATLLTPGTESPSSCGVGLGDCTLFAQRSEEVALATQRWLQTWNA